MLTYLSLGSNQGEREQVLNRAVELLQTRVGNVVRRSSFFYSKSWGYSSEHEFCNLCVAVDTPLLPLDLLHATQAIERELGKTTHTIKTYLNNIEQSAIYHDRAIDIDILTYEDILLQTPELTLPHPHMSERDFVLIPLREILS